MGADRALCPKNVPRSKAEGRTNCHRLAQGYTKSLSCICLRAFFPARFAVAIV
jgi:hypothetical protein